MTGEMQEILGQEQAAKVEVPVAVIGASAAGKENLFKFLLEERELSVPVYKAIGRISSKTDVTNTDTDEPTGAYLVHNFAWNDEKPFVEREVSSKTQLKQIGRSKDQEIDTAHRVTVNSTLYQKIVQSGTLFVPLGNGEFDQKEISKEQMIQHGKIYPESADEAIEQVVNIPNVSRYGNSFSASGFEFLFQAPEQIQILWTLGSKANPNFAGLFTFKSPSSEERESYEQAVQKITSKRRGDMSIAELEENFVKKIQYGAKHLLKVEGITYGQDDREFTKDPKELNEFIVNFNPLWFAELIDKMHSCFAFMKAKQEQI